MQAKVLLAWVEQIQRTSPKSLAGKRVIELGSGIGLSGIAFLLAGCDVTFTDQAVMIPLLKQNVEVNSVNAGARTRAHVAEFNWYG
jgi:predicted nicotinamide N-methyase